MLAADKTGMKVIYGMEAYFDCANCDALAQGEEGTREAAIIGKFEAVATNSDMDKLLMQPVQENNGWVRYYFIVETADASA